MKRDTKIILGCLSAGVLLVGCLCCGGLAWSTASFGDMADQAMASESEGAAIGRAAATHEECIAASLPRADACGFTGLGCAVQLNVFANACLQTVRADAGAFCDQVPVQGSAGFDDAARAFCRDNGRAELGGCLHLFQAKTEFCSGWRAYRGPRPRLPDAEGDEGDEGTQPALGPPVPPTPPPAPTTPAGSAATPTNDSAAAPPL